MNNNLQFNNIIVTGASGFVGAHVVCQLVKMGFNPIACKTQFSSLNQFNFIANYYQINTLDVVWQTINLQDIDSLLNVFNTNDLVIHCAAKVSFSKKDKDNLFNINVMGTANLVNACLENKVKKLVHCSSIAALGRGSLKKLVTENSEWEENNNNTVYAKSKYLAEIEIWRGFEEGLDVFVLYPAFILGIGIENIGSNTLFGSVKKGLNYYPTGTNGFVDVEDVAHSLISAAFGPTNFNKKLCVSESITFLELFTEMARNYNKKPPKFPISGLRKKIVINALRLLERIGVPHKISAEAIKNASNITVYQSVYPELTLNFKYTKISDTIKKSIGYWQNIK